MGKTKWGGLVVLCAVLVLVSWSSTAQSQRIGQGGRLTKGTLTARIAGATKFEEKDVAKMIEALGPALRDMLADGQTVDVPNLGTFRVVRVAEHRDLAAGGRPVVIPAVNSVEFLPGARLVDAANGPNAKPAETVPAFEYNPLPSQTKGLKTGNGKSGGVREP